jgi:hypothetical protein
MSELRVELPGLDCDEFEYGRRLLAKGGSRNDLLVFTRGGKPAISATVGWWADHRVTSDKNGSPVFRRFQGGAAGSPESLEAASDL